MDQGIQVDQGIPKKKQTKDLKKADQEIQADQEQTWTKEADQEQTLTKEADQYMHISIYFRLVTRANKKKCV